MFIFLKDYSGKDIYFNLTQVKAFGAVPNNNYTSAWITIGNGDEGTFYLQSTVEDILKQIPEGGF